MILIPQDAHNVWLNFNLVLQEKRFMLFSKLLYSVRHLLLLYAKQVLFYSLEFWLFKIKNTLALGRRVKFINNFIYQTRFLPKIQSEYITNFHFKFVWFTYIKGKEMWLQFIPKILSSLFGAYMIYLYYICHYKIHAWNTSILCFELFFASSHKIMWQKI